VNYRTHGAFHNKSCRPMKEPVMAPMVLKKEEGGRLDMPTLAENAFVGGKPLRRGGSEEQVPVVASVSVMRRATPGI